MTTKTPRPPRRPVGASTVDEHLAHGDEPERSVLARLRAEIRAAAPQVAAVISYQIPTYRLNGPLVRFAVQPKHLAFTVVSLAVVETFRDALAEFDVSGRTVRSSAERPPRRS